MRTLKAVRKIASLCLLAMASGAFAQGIALSTNTVVAWAGVESGKAILTKRDEFIAAMSPFDRAARMKTDQAVAEADFLKFLGQNVEPWSPDETNAMAGVMRNVKTKLAPWNLPFPAIIWLIKTSGLEEGRASYTRQNAVILPRKELLSAPGHLQDIIIHELFHIVSRHNPDLRTRLYHGIGFSPINQIEYPEELRERRITNPDGVQDGWMIKVTHQNQPLSAIQVLYASSSRYDPVKGGEFFDYLVFKLLVVNSDGNRWQAKLVDGHPQLLEPKEVQGFFEQVGSNTGYIIHPDEILAANFVRLINDDANLPTPGVIAEMKKILGQRRP